MSTGLASKPADPAIALAADAMGDSRRTPAQPAQRVCTARCTVGPLPIELHAAQGLGHSVVMTAP